MWTHGKDSTFGPNTYRIRTAVLFGAVISVVRLALFWAGVTLTAEYADWRQIAGSAILMINSIVEIGIASAFTRSRPGGSLLAAALIVLTSAVLGWGWARRRFESSGR